MRHGQDCMSGVQRICEKKIKTSAFTIVIYKKWYIFTYWLELGSNGFSIGKKKITHILFFNGKINQTNQRMITFTWKFQCRHTKLLHMHRLINCNTAIYYTRKITPFTLSIWGIQLTCVTRRAKKFPRQ